MNVLDLFCGAGGLSLGFKNVGFNIVGGIDFNKDAIETHSRNFKNGFHFCGDIATLDDDFIKQQFLGKVDVIVGGPPCQGFSAANKWQESSIEDPRNKLFYEFIRFVKTLKPKAFVMENVKGILTKENGYVKDTMIEIMSEIGYRVNVKVLLASDYGVPQNRSRAFFIGIREDLDAIFDFNRLEKKQTVTVEDAISDLYNICEENIGKDGLFSFINQKPLSKYQKLMRKDSNDFLYNHNIKFPQKKVQERMSYVPEGGNWKYVPEYLWDTIRTNRHSSAYRRLNSKEPSITIDTGHMNYFHPLYNRVPTVRESARIQSFPDDFIFLGSQGAQFRQVGNAVPPLLSEAIAKILREYIKEK